MEKEKKRNAYTLVEAAEWRMAHNNVWHGVNGMVSNTWKPCVCVQYYFSNSVPAITKSPSSPIKVPSAACATHIQYTPQKNILLQAWKDGTTHLKTPCRSSALKSLTPNQCSTVGNHSNKHKKSKTHPIWISLFGPTH
jgi:hypothetical protein